MPVLAFSFLLNHSLIQLLNVMLLKSFIKYLKVGIMKSKQIPNSKHNNNTIPKVKSSGSFLNLYLPSDMPLLLTLFAYYEKRYSFPQ